MNNQIFPNPYLLGIGITIFAYMLIYGLKRLLCTRMARFSGKRNKWDDNIVDTLEQTTHLFMFVSALYIGFRYVPNLKQYGMYANRTFFIFLMWQVTVWGNYIVNKWISNVISKRTKKNPAAMSSISLVQLFAKIVLFSFILLFTLSNLNIQVTTMLAGLGVGGIAVALALQNILGDLFSSLSIVLDKPFVVGDFIVMDQYMGEVEKIGLKTTRIRSLSGEQIICSNSDLLSARIRNFKRLYERRVPFILNLPFQTSVEQLQRAVEIVSDIIKSTDRVRFDRVHFMRISTYTLDIEAVYWVLHDDYNVFMDIHQIVLLEIYKQFRQEGLEFAYPTQNLLIRPAPNSEKFLS